MDRFFHSPRIARAVPVEKPVPVRKPPLEKVVNNILQCLENLELKPQATQMSYLMSPVEKSFDFSSQSSFSLPSQSPRRTPTRRRSVSADRDIFVSPSRYV